MRTCPLLRVMQLLLQCICLCYGSLLLIQCPFLLLQRSLPVLPELPCLRLGLLPRLHGSAAGSVCSLQLLQQVLPHRQCCCYQGPTAAASCCSSAPSQTPLHLLRRCCFDQCATPAVCGCPAVPLQSPLPLHRQCCC